MGGYGEGNERTDKLVTGGCLFRHSTASHYHYPRISLPILLHLHNHLVRKAVKRWQWLGNEAKLINWNHIIDRGHLRQISTLLLSFAVRIIELRLWQNYHDRGWEVSLQFNWLIHFGAGMSAGTNCKESCGVLWIKPEKCRYQIRGISLVKLLSKYGSDITS